LTNLLKRLLMK